jgi:vacuolar protein sorting-associated protein 13A/C
MLAYDRVFMKPFEGAKKGGVTGFFKGTLQGLSGLVIKPVTGILDAAAKTTEGIKNTV